MGEVSEKPGTGSTPEKKRRRRMKRLMSNVKSQMEFYFGDSNLNKDRYLWNIIQQSEDGYVDLDIFKNFNKMKSLSTESSVIAKALNESSLLELDDERLQVRRKTPILEPIGLDEKTIYVEHLPSSADHDWIRKLFNRYGPINYISVPKYKHSGCLKGFAFVEFDSALSALKACEHFGAQCADLRKYTSSLHENKEEPVDKCDSVDTNKTIMKKERDISEGGTENEKMIDKCDPMRTEEQEKPKNETGSSKTETETKEKHKKRRKRKKKSVDAEELETITLRVMSKLEWKAWRKKYLALQKAAMAEIKKSLSLIKKEELKLSVVTTDAVEPAMTSVNEEVAVSKKNDPIPYVADVILHVTVKAPISDLKVFKKEVKLIADVAFIDISFDNNVYMRCKDPESAQILLKSKDNIPGAVETRLLKGDEEAEYWKKILENQKSKYQNNRKVNKKRGYDKIIQKVEKVSKHIRFE